MERTIRVTGKGKLAVHPDTIRLRLCMEGMHGEYQLALQTSSMMTEELKKLIEHQGFCRNDLKTLNFQIDAEYESYQDKKDKSWKRRFSGYKFEHRMKLEFPSDNDKLGRLLYALAHSNVHPEISIEYTVADPEAAKGELLRKAVQDSKAKADVLTSAAGVQLGCIRSIDYSWRQIEMVTRPLDRAMLMAPTCDSECNSYQMDIDPDDIDIEDTVTVVWDIQ